MTGGMSAKRWNSDANTSKDNYNHEITKVRTRCTVPVEKNHPALAHFSVRQNEERSDEFVEHEKCTQADLNHLRSWVVPPHVLLVDGFQCLWLRIYKYN